MKISFTILLFLVVQVCLSQETKPIFKTKGLANKSAKRQNINEPKFTMVVYGSIGCGWSSLLIETLYNNADSITSKYKNLQIVLLMDQDLELINAQMQKYFDTFPIYSNYILKINVKKSDVTPQTFLYQKDKMIFHFSGVSKAKLDKIFKKVRKASNID